MNASPVINLLHRANQALRWAHLLTISCSAACLLVLAAIVMIFTDAIFALPPVGLITLDIIIALAIFFSISTLLIAYIRSRFNANRVALIVEDRLNLTNSPLINTLELSSQHCTTGSSTALAELAVAQGNEIATKLSTDRIPDWKPVKKSLLSLTALFVCTIIAYILIPSVFNAVLPRLLSPYANHPPFTFVNFNITTNPDQILHGLPVTINAQLSGFITPDTADLVFVDDNNQPIQRIEMSPVLNAKPIATASLASAAPATKDQGNHFQFHIKSAEKTRNYYIDTPHGRSAIQTLTVIPVPRFIKVYATLDFPDYTQWDDTQIPITAQGITALTGTNISLTVHSNVPLTTGTLDITQAIPVPGNSKTTDNNFKAYFKPHEDDPTIATASFVIHGNGNISASITGNNNIQSRDPFACKINATPDEMPEVYIVDPEQRTMVPEDYVLDVQIEATDDIGLSNLTINRAINAWGNTSTDVPLEINPKIPTRGSATYTFDIPKLGARPGDVIEYVATIYDTHPSGKQFTQTDIFTIEVISIEEYLEHARTQYRIDDLNAEYDEYLEQLKALEEQREEIIEQLDKLQAKLESGEQLSPTEQKQLEDLQNKLEEYEKQTEQLAKELEERANAKQLYEFEQPYLDMLRELSNQLNEQSNAANKLNNAMQPAANAGNKPLTPEQRKKLQDAAKEFREKQDPFTEEAKQQRKYTDEDLKKLEVIDKLMAQGDRIKYVITQQQDVAKRYAALKNKQNLSAADKEQLKRLAQEERDLEEELKDATEQLRQVASDPQNQQLLPKMTSGALKMCDKIDNLDANQDMQQAADQSVNEQAREAYDSAQLAADKLDSLLSDCQGMGKQACEELDGCFGFGRDKINKGLQQMQQGRGMPGSGQGSDGYGMYGSNANMGLRGNARSSRGQGDGSRGKKSKGKGKGSANNNDIESLDPAESLTADQSVERTHGSTLLRGTPLPYREEANEYFKRLAQDEANQPEQENNTDQQNNKQ